MGKREPDDLTLTDRGAFLMCRKKRKFKSSEASLVASIYNQRKYECPVCGHWHLTKRKGEK